MNYGSNKMDINSLFDFKKYIEVFDILGDAVSIQGKDYKVIYQNEAHIDLIGKHTGEYCYKAFEKRDHRCKECPVAKTFEDGNRYKEERKAPVDNGHVHVEIASSPIKDSKGNIIAAVEMVRDITSRQHAKVELEKIFDLTPEMLCVAGSDGYYKKLNKSWEKVLGYTVEELLLNPFIDLVHPDDREATIQVLDKLTSGERVIYFENRYKSKHGTYKTLAWNANPIEDGKIYAAARDITEKKDTEAKLRKSEERYRTLFENATDIIQIIRPDGQLLDVNSSWCDALGYNLEEAKKLTVFDILDPECKDECVVNFSRALTKGTTGIVDTAFRTKDGEKVTLRGSANCIYRKGKPSYVHCVFHDITERMKLEDQLRQSQKMEAVGTMAGGIAHDFNNILTIIAGNTGLALDDIPADSPARRSIEKILKASIRATDLVSQILAFSRKEKKELIPIRPQVLIKETLKFLRSTTPTTISIVQSISNDCGKILADPTGLHQVTMNLFTNAVHALDEKGEIIVKLQEVDLNSDDLKKFPHITSFSVKTPGKYARLSVSDEGTGMDEKTIKRVFDPFYTTKEVGKGTGMGLSVVHGIVESHSGFMAVESKPGQGSTFSVFIPISEVEEEKLLETDTVEASPAGTERILVVDDEKALLELAGRILKRLGYAVTSESSSIKALELFRTNPDQFDLVITDQSMPNMSGTELVAEILKISPDLPCILCSGFSSKVSEANVGEKGISKYLKKPYNKKILSEAVREVLNGKM